jgi:hypothetical protein
MQYPKLLKYIIFIVIQIFSWLVYLQALVIYAFSFE